MGFAPNPYFGYCTLACCKPVIRRKANVGDWIVGTGSVTNVGNNRLLYVMKVTEKMLFEKYAVDSRFHKKIPSKGLVEERGDNIYYRDEHGEWQRRQAYHYSDDQMQFDLSGTYVLISDYFFYFGRNAVKIPDEFKEIFKRGPGHKCKFSSELKEKFIAWIKDNYTQGIAGEPSRFTTILN